MSYMPFMYRNYCELGPRITDTDLLECNDAALEWIQSWRGVIRYDDDLGGLHERG